MSRLDQSTRAQYQNGLPENECCYEHVRHEKDGKGWTPRRGAVRLKDEMNDRFETPENNDVARCECKRDDTNLNDTRTGWTTSSQLLNAQIRCLQRREYCD